MSTYISIKDAAKLLNMSEQRVRVLCRSNALPAKKLVVPGLLKETTWSITDF